MVVQKGRRNVVGAGWGCTWVGVVVAVVAVVAAAVEEEERRPPALKSRVALRF